MTACRGPGHEYRIMLQLWSLSACRLSVLGLGQVRSAVVRTDLGHQTSGTRCLGCRRCHRCRCGCWCWCWCRGCLLLGLRDEDSTMCLASPRSAPRHAQVMVCLPWACRGGRSPIVAAGGAWVRDASGKRAFLTLPSCTKVCLCCESGRSLSSRPPS